MVFNKPKHMSRYFQLVFVLSVLLISFSFPPNITAQVNTWTTHTYMRNIVDMVYVDGSLWGATQGGLLRYNIDEDTFEKFTNTSGLLSNRVSAVEQDNRGYIWAAQENGFIHIFDPATGEFIDVVSEYQSMFISDLMNAGDTMYVSLDVGIGEYRIDRDEAKELYRQLGFGQAGGGFNQNTESPVNKTAIFDNHLYAATAQGVARADLDLTNLKAPQNWDVIAETGLANTNVIDLQVGEHAIYFLTANAVFRYDGTSTLDITSNLAGQSFAGLQAVTENSLATLYAWTNRTLYKTQDFQNWIEITRTGTDITNLKLVDNEIWLGSNASAFGVLDSDNQVSFLTPNGPKSSVFNSVVYDQRGYLWAVSDNGLMAYDGDHWFNFEDSDELRTGDFRKVAIDSLNRIWIGTFGHGIYVVDGTPEDFEIMKIDTTDGRLAGTNNVTGGGYVVVDDIQVDRQGTIWVTNFRANNGNPIVAISPDFSQWAYFPVTEGVRSLAVSSLQLDYTPRSSGSWIWYGTGINGDPGVGVGAIIWGEDPFNPADDDLTGGFVVQEGLLSNEVRAVAQDQDLKMWIGTSEGLNTYFAGSELSQFFGIVSGDRLISTDIYVVKIDAANNKWIGTSSGISVISPDENKLTHYTTDRSPLVANRIKDIAFNSQNGDVYIATLSGLSVLSTPFSVPQRDFSKIYGFPNPFIIEDGSAAFTFGNLMAQSGVQIFTEDGRVVRVYSPNDFSGIVPSWDGRNSDGELVPTGIYLYVGYTEAGDTGIGKIAVIRNQ